MYEYGELYACVCMSICMCVYEYGERYVCVCVHFKCTLLLMQCAVYMFYYAKCNDYPLSYTLWMNTTRCALIQVLMLLCGVTNTYMNVSGLSMTTR